MIHAAIEANPSPLRGFMASKHVHEGRTMVVWVSIGLALGAGLGFALGNFALGAAFGVALGAGLGAAMSKRKSASGGRP